MVDTVHQLEGLPPLRPPSGSETAPAETPAWDWPTPDATVRRTASVKRQRLPEYYARSLRRLRERRVDYAMIPATVALSVLVGAAIATAFK